MKKTTTLSLRCLVPQIPKILSFALFLGFSTIVFGQDSPSRAELSNGASSPPSVSTPTAKSMSIGLNVGLFNAPGLDFAYKFTSRWTMRVGFGYLGYGVTNYQYDYTSTIDGTLKTTSALIDVKLNMSNLNVMGEFSPGKKGRFRLMAGVAIFPTKNVQAGGKLNSTFQFNDLVITPEDIGSGTLTIGYKSKISPFIGMGFGRAIPRKRFNLSFDMGAHYMGDYKVGIDVNPGIILEKNEENAPILERNLNAKFQNKVMPSFNLRLAYKIK